MSEKMNTKTDLKASRGWTDSLIQKYLPTPDLEYPNPHSKKSGNVKLYSLSRIISIEESPDFVADKGKAERRKASGKQGAETKRATLLLEMEQYKPSLKILSREELFEKAKEHYSDLWTFRDSSKLRNLENPDQYFWDRIATNYLRHELSDYETKLNAIARKVGVDDAYQIIRKKLDTAIFEAYPFLNNL